MIWCRLPILVLVAFIILLDGRVSSAKDIIAEGVIRSDERVEIRSKVATLIRRIPVQEGGVYRAGELLVELANDVERAKVETAKAEVQRAMSALAEAEVILKIAARELERNLTLEGLIPDKDIDLSRDAVQKGEAALKTKQDDLAKAEAQLAEAGAIYEDTLIRAPFDGLVSRLYVRVGDTPRRFETVLFDFLSLDKLCVEVALPLDHLQRVHEGMAVNLVLEEGHASIKTSVIGKVRYIYPEIDPITRMFRVKVDVPTKGSLILPGMFAKVVFELPKSTR